MSKDTKTLLTDVVTVIIFAAVSTAIGVLLMGWFGLLCAIGPLGMLLSAAIKGRLEKKE